ncbi:ABC transporter ATP-binding protein [Secundilactobacillus paracollinoides]|uniref:ABC transporter ATP-binding protein n=1 Tax=Secundilactobacillus paracollinoides TaxID=240427 RepID=A0A1B2IWL6_9LACO|nr:ABC transporter ATP-binding protein [Secundilactobacillus paracollinoides]ANZ66421.1 ABC transporter ATP-binding protein [Secundilactobacillus paracollinoides]
MSELSIQDLTKTFKTKVAVNHLDMQIPSGKFIAFLGPNGAGKSTTVGMLTGLTQPTSGQIKLGTLTPADIAYRQQIGVVFQYGVLDDNLTVHQNLKLRAAMYPNVDKAWLDRLENDLGLTPLLNQRYGTLSGGQRRRVDISRAMIHRPKILILDEPSTGLDIPTRTVIWQVIHQLRKELQMTVILTTHYLEEAEAADFVYVIDHGEVIAADSVSHLKHEYAQVEMTLISDQPETLLANLQQDGYQAKQAQEKVTLTVADAQTSIDVLVKNRQYIQQFDSHEGDMNTIFLALTGKEIR